MVSVLKSCGDVLIREVDEARIPYGNNKMQLRSSQTVKKQSYRRCNSVDWFSRIAPTHVKTCLISLGVEGLSAKRKADNEWINIGYAPAKLKHRQDPLNSS